MRRLVVCCDGTWNTDDQKAPTNVVKIARAVLPMAAGVSQITYYHPGVGTGNKIDQLEGGAIGLGLDANVKDAYRFLVENYTETEKDGKVEKDEIFLFGFSRGAYTARCVAGLIRKCGILKKSLGGMIDDAYALYRRRNDDVDAPDVQHFRDTYARTPNIKFIGVWDTVGSYGVPSGLKGFDGLKEKYQFHDLTLSKIVENAYHALAIDERRGPFEPTLWTNEPKDGQTLEQRWFPGVHSNVGGGYPDDGLSNRALHWIAENAGKCGLLIDTSYLSGFKSNPRGTLYDSKTGFAWHFLAFIDHDYVRAVAAHPDWKETVDFTSVIRYHDASIDPRYQPANLRAWIDQHPADPGVGEPVARIPING